MKLDEDMHVDGQSIGIVKDKETSTSVDYFFEAYLWCKDPRFQSRSTKTGGSRGLFRFDKETLTAQLLFPMTGGDAGSGSNKAASKVLEELHSTGCWPASTASASG